LDGGVSGLRRRQTNRGEAVWDRRLRTKLSGRGGETASVESAGRVVQIGVSGLAEAQKAGASAVWNQGGCAPKLLPAVPIDTGMRSEQALPSRQRCRRQARDGLCQLTTEEAHPAPRGREAVPQLRPGGLSYSVAALDPR
jgi:hypothetical protein